MKSLLAFLAAPLLISNIALSQSVATVPSLSDSAPVILALTRSHVVGFTTKRAVDSQRLRADPDSARPSLHLPTRLGHSLPGGFIGGLAGAVLGAAVGGIVQARDTSGEAMVSAVMIFGLYGAIGGTGVGLITGFLWPVH